MLMTPAVAACKCSERHKSGGGQSSEQVEAWWLLCCGLGLRGVGREVVAGWVGFSNDGEGGR